MVVYLIIFERESLKGGDGSTNLGEKVSRLRLESDGNGVASGRESATPGRV